MYLPRKWKEEDRAVRKKQITAFTFTYTLSLEKTSTYFSKHTCRHVRYCTLGASFKPPYALLKPFYLKEKSYITFIL